MIGRTALPMFGVCGVAGYLRCCGPAASGLSGVRWVAAASVKDILFVSGNGVLRGVAVSAAVYG